MVQCAPCPTGPTGPTGFTGPTGETGPAAVTSTVATAFSSGSQTLVEDVAALVLHDTVPFSYGITTTTGASGSFTVPTTGVYKIFPSLQLLGQNAGTISIWIKVNGSNIPDSATLTRYKQNDEMVIACEYLLELTAGDSIQVWALAQGNNCTIHYIPAGGAGANAYPAAPGIITNMYRVR